jgi:phosphoribosylaminoimidazolecarboxamide formyltransferase/IMP cyclohydrolase
MSASQTKIKSAILSVTDKTGLVEFARKLAGLGVELISTGGTAKLLRDSGVSVKDISELTGFPEMLDGRVKTLHPKVHEGILHRRENPSHRTAVAEHGIEAIDMVVVNLYAFEKTAAKPGVPFEDLIENIDIGGPSMIRSAAKNFQDVAVVTSPTKLRRDRGRDGEVGRGFRQSPSGAWRRRPLRCHAAYDSAIASTLERVSASAWPLRVPLRSRPAKSAAFFQKVMDLRYGGDPHQKAAMYSDSSAEAWPMEGKFREEELSYNNIVDLQAAWELFRIRRDGLRHLSGTPIVRHRSRQNSRRGLQSSGMRPGLGLRRRNRKQPHCGWRCRRGKWPNSLLKSSPHRPLMMQPRQNCGEKKNLRLRKSPALRKRVGAEKCVRWNSCQDADVRPWARADLKVVTKRQPTAEEKRALLFAWKVAKHVKSKYHSLCPGRPDRRRQGRDR